MISDPVLLKNPGIKTRTGCAGRAGTLTLNQLSVRGEDMLVMKGFSQQDAVRLGALSANPTTGEPIDVVLNDAYRERSADWLGRLLTGLVLV